MLSERTRERYLSFFLFQQLVAFDHSAYVQIVSNQSINIASVLSELRNVDTPALLPVDYIPEFRAAGVVVGEVLFNNVEER